MNPGNSFTSRQAAQPQVDGDGWSSAPSPWVVMKDVCSRPRPSAHIIVFANEKGGVGKSTLAFHSSIALSYSGANVLAIDLDYRQRSLARSMEMREGTGRALKINMPTPKYLTMEKQSGSLLFQELRRLDGKADFVIIDLPGADSSIARYAIAMADTIVTPVGSSTYDLNCLGRINPISLGLSAKGQFAELVSEMRSARSNFGLPPSDWIVMKNRFRGADRRLEDTASQSLESMSASMDFRIGTGLHESLSFRDLNSYGLTYLDLKLIPGLGKRRYQIEKTIGNLVRQYRLPGFVEGDKIAIKPSDTASKNQPKAAMSKTDSTAYWEAMLQHRQKSGTASG